jgi:hypothetical protein
MWPWLLAAALIAVAFSLSFGASLAVNLEAFSDYNAPGWTLRHLPNKWLYKAGTLLRGDVPEGERDRRVARYFELNRLIDAAERVLTDPRTPPTQKEALREQLEALRSERERIENSVEDVLEGRMTGVLEDLGLASSPLGPPGPEVVWPPVDVEFDRPPGVLVVSPRERIAVLSEHLVPGGLTPEEMDAIEESYRPKNLSALVAGVRGIGTYPALVQPEADYEATLQSIAHEWLHHYLFFSPLGRRYFSSSELVTLNETVANIAGREIGSLVAARYPLSERGATAQRIDLTATLRQLRVDVEALLVQGRVDDAERLMEERRQFLASHGYYFRKINQAFFAFHGRYADTPASVDPIGPKLQALRAASPDVGAFLRRVRTITSAADLDLAVAAVTK